MGVVRDDDRGALPVKRATVAGAQGAKGGCWAQARRLPARGMAAAKEVWVVRDLERIYEESRSGTAQTGRAWR